MRSSPTRQSLKEKGLLHIEFEVLAWQEVRGALLPQKIRQKLYFEDTEVREILYSVDAYEFPKENKYSVPYADAVEINDLDYEEIIPAE